jgi:chromosome segregation protein
MKLKRLEISGFKSFRDKVILDFSDGVSAIVGPNGCGKSNIIDALRWVMGEQRVKALRGKKMDDVIFNGSQEASPIGKAEVAMVLACTDGQIFPGVYAACSEVSISRKIFRDGESEYAINQIPCRLLDVKEFFMGTGVGARTYSLVEQNSVSNLVEAKPEERRHYIEEAAGVSKYKSRKDAAVRKMEATKQNLLRLNDVLREVKNQLNAVARQAKRAEQYRVLKASIKEGEVSLALHSYQDLSREKASLDASRQSLETQIQDEGHVLQSCDTSAESVRLEIMEQEALRSRLQEELYQVKNQIHLKEQAIEFSRGKVADIQARKARNLADLEESRDRLDAIASEQDRLKAAVEAQEAETEKARGEISAAEHQNEETRLEERDLQKKIEEQKVNISIWPPRKRSSKTWE